MHALRRDRAAAVAASLGADAVLITKGVNVRYLTGLVSSNAAVLIPVQRAEGSEGSSPTAGTAVLGTDSRYAGTAERACPDVELLIEREVEAALAGMALEGGLGVIAFEDLEMTVHRHRELTGRGDGSPHAAPELVGVGSAIDQLRMVKDEDEIALLGRACSITAEAFSAVLGRLAPGVTEREYAIALERTMIDLGADAAGLRQHRRERAEWRDPASRPWRPRFRARRPGDGRLRRPMRRLPRRHDQDGRTRQACKRGSGRSIRSSLTPRPPAWPPPWSAPTSPTWTRSPVT